MLVISITSNGRALLPTALLFRSQFLAVNRSPAYGHQSNFAMLTPFDSHIFHLCSRAALTAACAVGTYRADSLATEGFIHLSRAHQVSPTARLYFVGVPDVVVLVVDPARLTARLVYELPASVIGHTSAPPDEVTEAHFPHCYGEINLAAIVDVIELAQFHTR